MFCPKCGKADQEVNTYCRQCGDYLPDLANVGKRRQLQTPADQFRLSLTFNLLSAIAGISMAIALIVTHAGEEGTHPVIYAAVSLFFVISAWQIVSFFNNWSLRSRFVRKKQEEADQASILPVRETNELLPEADMSHVAPASVTEHSTRRLGEKIRVSTKSKKESD